jgi:hypothetical protein
MCLQAKRNDIYIDILCTYKYMIYYLKLGKVVCGLIIFCEHLDVG